MIIHANVTKFPTLDKFHCMEWHWLRQKCSNRDASHVNAYEYSCVAGTVALHLRHSLANIVEHKSTASLFRTATESTWSSWPTTQLGVGDFRYTMTLQYQVSRAYCWTGTRRRFKKWTDQMFLNLQTCYEAAQIRIVLLTQCATDIWVFYCVSMLDGCRFFFLTKFVWILNAH